MTIKMELSFNKNSKNNDIATFKMTQSDGAYVNFEDKLEIIPAEIKPEDLTKLIMFLSYCNNVIRAY